MRSVLSRSDTRQQPVFVSLSFSRRQGRRRGSVLGMFNSHEVKVLNQPDGGEGK
jgi:hypothetical protein